MILAFVQRFRGCVLSAALAAATLLPSELVHGQSVPGQGSWETTLLGRDINGNAIASNNPLAVFLYDTSLDVTWLRNAEASGLLDWPAAKNWASTLNVGGFTGWRLPTHADTGAPGCNWGYSGTDCSYNVM
jgi:hypothetical protein